MMETKNNRRQFFKLLFGAVALAPILRVADVFAKAAMPKSEKIKKKMIDEKTAKRLKYVEAAEDAKKGKAAANKDFKKYTDGAMCSNCKFYKADKGEPDWGKCTMAANRYVYKTGWCKSYRKA